MYRLEEKIIDFGMAPTVTVIIYLLMNRYYGDSSKWFFIKEIWIALIYTLAIWGGSIIYAGDRVSLGQGMLIGSFFLVIFSNVLIYSIYEFESDVLEKNRSIARDFGIKATVNTCLFSLTLSILIALSAFIFSGTGFMLSLPLVLIASSMLLVLSFPKVFTNKKLYGVIADLLLLLFLLSLYN
jgi:4-hydroxybenzoate polyprenyltransferase